MSHHARQSTWVDRARVTAIASGAGLLMMVQAAGAGGPKEVLPGAAPTCAGWPVQGGPESDRTGLGNTNYPEASTTTYWTTKVQAPMGSILTMRGRFPYARFTALEIYTGDQLVDHLSDVDIVPDPGQNNPFVSGTLAGTYTARLVIGPKPSNPQPNTLYSGTLTAVVLMYRIYHATDPNSPAGGATNPVLPDLSLNGVVLPSCAVRPFLKVQDSTPWGRLDNGDWIGAPPTARTKLAASDPPVWIIVDPYQGHYFPNGANWYMSTMLSREYLSPNTEKNLYVVRFKAPTFPKTRSGEPVYLDRHVRFWSMCTDDPYTTNVNRCVPDDHAQLDADGFTTFVISDPGSKPSDAALIKFSANWIAWGALQLSSDVVYDRSQRAWGTRTPVHYYNALLYRQTLSNPLFAESFTNAAKYPSEQWPVVMGPYLPVGGYCTTAAFNALGVGCVGR